MTDPAAPRSRAVTPTQLPAMVAAWIEDALREHPGRAVRITWVVV